MKDDNLIAAIKFVQPAMGNKDFRFYINSICIDAEKGLTTLVATNGHVIAAIEIDAALPKGRYIVPTELVKRFLQVFKPCDYDLTIAVSGLEITFSNGETTLTGKLVDGTYPNWRSGFDKQIKRKKHYKDEVGIDGKYLEAVGKMGKAIRASIRLKVVSPNDAIRFDFDPSMYGEVHNPRALVMPMKL
jgi:DNA polymerase III sliding clamp (beta) subunit (PCNA family)